MEGPIEVPGRSGRRLRGKKMRNLVIAGILIFTAVPALLAQAISVGEQVEFSCTRVTSGWCSGRVEAINGGTIKVKWGNMRDQFTMVSRDQVRAVPKPPGPEQVAMWEGFRTEVLSKSKAGMYLRIYAHYYQPDEFSYAGGNPTSADGWQQMTATLGEIDALCKGKYRGITNFQQGVKPNDISARYADWCRIADQRLALEPKIRAGAAKHMLSPSSDILDINKAIEHSRNLMWDKTQMVLYEPEKWKAKTAADLKQAFADYGTAMPADFFDEIDKKTAELRAVIDKTAPTKSFDQPAHRDAAVERVVKSRIAAKYPGTQIVSIGGSYRSWEKREGADLIRSDTDVKVYRLTVNYYKRGYALVKMPNRPYCQMRSWIVRQRGMAVDLGEAGEFMKCQ